jgi:hypothetical protein
MLNWLAQHAGAADFSIEIRLNPRTPDIAKANGHVRTLLPAHLLGSLTALPLGSSEN